MRFLTFFLLLVILGLERSRGHQMEFDSNYNKTFKQKTLADVSEDIHNIDFSKSYFEWAPWSACLGGRKTRRRHCLNRYICGDSLRIEVASCGKFRPPQKQTENIYKQIMVINPVLRQLNFHFKDVPNKSRGFSPWSNWTPCSRKCTTLRKRHCLETSLCGSKLMRESAYCYLEGSHCQLWIQSKIHRKKDPEYTITDTMPQPVPAVHPEHSRALYNIPSCGRLGRNRSSSFRLKDKMKNMVRIIGGKPAPPGKWIWQVAVLNRYKEAFCGGTLIALRWVVTAAHCVRKRLYVRLGEHDLLVRGYGEMEMRVTKVVIHPQYDQDTVINDVALLRLPTPARPDLGHGIACLPSAHQILPPHTNCVILGWGKKHPSDVHGTRILHEAQVSTIHQRVCRRSYWQYAITDNMVCAGRGLRDSCAGDSGGPLLCRDRTMRYVLQGVTSFGDGCGKRGKYGIYTRTAGYVDWIRDVINDKLFYE